MSAACGQCGALRPELPAWVLLVPMGLGAASLALIVVFKGRAEGRILAGIVTAAFLGFGVWLARRVKAVLSRRCAACGHRAG